MGASNQGNALSGSTGVLDSLTPRAVGAPAFRRRADILHAAAAVQRSAAERAANPRLARQLRSCAAYNLRLAYEAGSAAYGL